MHVKYRSTRSKLGALLLKRRWMPADLERAEALSVLNSQEW